jgi:hypothetical protein
MRSIVTAGFALLLALWVGGCAREKNHTKSANSQTLKFTKAGVSLTVGEEWQCSNLEPEHALLPPTLVSPAGRIRVLLLPPDRSDPVVVANTLRASFEVNAHAAKHSFRRQEIVGSNGLRIICVSSMQQLELDGRLKELQSSDYLVRNRSGRCVAINYSAEPGSDADAVQRMIQKTLALQ